MRFRRLLIVLLVTLPRLAIAQSASTGTPVPIALAKNFAVDAPPTWAPMTNVIAPGNAFKARTDAAVSAVLQRVGQRPTDMPYAIVETWIPDDGLAKPAVFTRQELVDRIVEYYRTALNPPSKADRSPSWRKARVSTVRYDSIAQRYSFDATLNYDTVGDIHVVVSCVFDGPRVLIFSGWSDAAFDAAHPRELSAIRDTLRVTNASGATVVSPGAYLVTIAQVVVGLFVIAIVVLQLVVLYRDRRERRPFQMN